MLSYSGNNRRVRAANTTRGATMKLRNVVVVSLIVGASALASQAPVFAQTTTVAVETATTVAGAGDGGATTAPAVSVAQDAATTVVAAPVPADTRLVDTADVAADPVPAGGVNAGLGGAAPNESDATRNAFASGAVALAAGVVMVSARRRNAGHRS
jgi:hypothetical protein